MRRLIDIGIIVTLAILFLASMVDAQRTSRLTRPCPGSATPASVTISTLGDVTIAPCANRTFSLPATTSARLLDPAYTPLFAGTNYFSIGSDNTFSVPATDNLIGSDIYLPFTSTGSGKFYVGSNVSVLPAGSPVNPFIIGSRTDIFTNGFGATGNSQVYGNFTNVDIGFPVTTAVGGFFGALSGGSGASGSGTITALQAYVGGAHNGTLTNAYAIDAKYATSASSPSTTSNAIIGRFWASFNTGVETTSLKGIALQEWASNGGTVSTSYGIYADTSIDVGSTRWFIWSGSTSPSFLSGKLSFDATYTAGGTTGNRTINKPAFSVNFAAAASSLTVTNSFITSASMLLCTVQTADGTMKSVSAVAGVGSVLLTGNAAATAETKVYCEVRN